MLLHSLSNGRLHVQTVQNKGGRVLQFRRKKTKNTYNKAIKEDVGVENHATGDGEGKRNLPGKKKTQIGGQGGEHDRCPPLCGGPQCAEGLIYSRQASEEALGPRSSLWKEAVWVQCKKKHLPSHF